MAISLAHKAITVDINSRNAPNLVAIANVNDKATRYLDVTLTASGKKLSFADCTATATFVTEGILISDEVICTLNSAADVITVPLDDLKSTAGFLSIEIKIKNGETQVLNTPLALKVQITPSLTDGSKINKDSVGTTAAICREVAAARGESETLGERLDNLLPDDVGVITTDHMRDGSVKTNKIADATVTASKLSRDLLTLINSVVNKANTADVEKLLALKANTSDVDTTLATKADKATTLDGYGITDAYTKTTVKTLLAGKLDAMSFDSEPTQNSPCYLTSGTVYNALLMKADKNAVDTALTSKANLISGPNIFDFNKWAGGLQNLTKSVFRGTLDEVDFAKKTIKFTATGSGAYTNGWNNSPAEMIIAVKPKTAYTFSWHFEGGEKTRIYLFFNGENTDETRLTSDGKAEYLTFTTLEDTSFITIRFDTLSAGTTVTVSKIMIEEGNKSLLYIPHAVAEGVNELAQSTNTALSKVNNTLDLKYDSSNIETGKGNLAPAQAIYDGFEGSFNYVKIGKTVTVALNITTLIAGKNYVQFAGLPFKAMTASKLSSIAVYTTANKLVNLRLDGSGLYVSSPGTTFADGEKINAIITYIIG